MNRKLCLNIYLCELLTACLSYLIRWLTFRQSGCYINMSRVDPNNITVSYFGSQRFIVLPGSNTQCVCVSLIYVHDCSVVFGKQSGETRSKKVGGVLHIQEMERLAACFCMQYDMVSELNANAYNWVLYFNTRNEDFQSRSGKSMWTTFHTIVTRLYCFKFSNQRRPLKQPSILCFSI